MVPVKVEGVRRNFSISSVYMYRVTLIDESGQRVFFFNVERHEALPLVAALHDFPQPRPQAIDVMVDALTLLGCTLEEVHINAHSRTTPLHNLSSCVLRWRNGEARQEQVRHMRPGDVLALALLMKAPLFLSDGLANEIGVALAEGETPELLFAKELLKRAGITPPLDKPLRLGFSKTPLRDALVKEFKADLLGKAAPFPEEDREQRKQDYLAFILGNQA
jgi:bifunctional DNase/RNase